MVVPGMRPPPSRGPEGLGIMLALVALVVAVAAFLLTVWP